jgi:ubiquinone/menaquinone biosynthesis C-methylase UbiE
MSTAALFERLAPRYDELWTDTAIGRAQRNATWRVMDGLFRAGDRVLDVGCGTGEDAAHLMARGISVHAVDASPAMVKEARARGVRAEVMRAQDLAIPGACFDGAISNFGALNCVDDLGSVARALGALIRPGGHVAICMIGRFSAWEMLSFKRALRRLPGRAGDVYYPTFRQLRRDFAADFDLLYWAGIGMLVPPSYVKLPARIVNGLASVDRFPFLRSCADHRLLVFRRK